MAGMQNFNQPSSQPPNKPPISPGTWILFILVFLIIMLLAVLTFAFRNYLLGALTTGLGVFLFFVADNTPFAQIRDCIAESAAHALDWLFTQVRTQLRDSAANIAVLILCLFLLRLLLSLLPLPLIPATTTNIDYCEHSLNIGIRNHTDTLGLSTGCIVFDTQRPDGTLKMQAAHFFKQGDIKNGLKTLAKSHQRDSSDGETLIYQEDQKVLVTHTPFITIVAPTILTGIYAYMGQEQLQGIVIAQQEFNKSNTALKLVVVIANMGSNQDTASSIIKLIVNAIKHRSSVIGIIGPPQCSQTKTSMDALNASKVELPVISPDVSCDDLTNYSPYLFQIAPANSILTQVAALYIKEILHVVHIVIFTNLADTEDTNNQANDIKKSFPIPPVIEPYEPGDVPQIRARILNMEQLQSVPGVIYFSGSSNDLSILLANLPATGPFAHVPVVGLDPLYSLGGYNQSNQQMRANFQRLKLVSLFFPDEATFLKEKPPAFLDEYTSLFDPNHTHPDGIYGFSRMDSAVALSYDAANVLLNALPATGTPITEKNIMAGLTNTADGGAWQGVTGQINFSNGNIPYKKAIIILTVDSNDKFHMVMLASGCYELDQCSQTLQADPNIIPGKISPEHRYVFLRYGKSDLQIMRLCS